MFRDLHMNVSILVVQCYKKKENFINFPRRLTDFQTSDNTHKLASGLFWNKF